MEYRVLGKTGLKVSRMGFGGIPIQRSDPEGARKLMGELMAAGVNFIDTGRAYTVSEEYLGYGLAGIREHFVLATKGRGRTKQAMAADIEASLRDLRTDHIDLYQLHNLAPQEFDIVEGPDGALEALLEARAAGKIGHIGITAHSLVTFEMALEKDWVETIMFPYNIVETQGEKLIRRCGEKNIGFIDMKPLAGGAIEDVPVALRYVLQNPDVTVTIPGMADLRELAQNVAVCSDRRPFQASEKARVLEIRSQLGTNFCRRCNYCAPCSVGISISSVFLFDGYLSRYGLEKWARERYAGLSVPASACIGCGACEDRCPYHLPIRKMLKAASQHFDK